MSLTAPSAAGETPEKSDAELVATLQEHHGDHSREENDAMSEVIRRCTPEVDMMLRRTNVGWSDMHDLEQEIFLLVAQNICRLRDPAAFHGWVKKIARHTALNWKTRNARKTMPAFSQLEKEGERPMDVEDDADGRPLHEVLAGETQQQLFRCLAEMKPTDRLRLRQFYLLDMSLNEIVEDGGGESELPLGTAKRQLHTARKRLREKLEPYILDQDS